MKGEGRKGSKKSRLRPLVLLGQEKSPKIFLGDQIHTRLTVRNEKRGFQLTDRVRISVLAWLKHHVEEEERRK